VKTWSKFAQYCAVLAISLTIGSQSLRAADAKVHHIAIQVSVNDPAVMNLALNNAVNVAQDYSAKAEEVEIEIVAYGPGLHMLRDDTSPVKARLKSIGESMPNVAFVACGNTQKAMQKAEGKEIPLVSRAKVVPAGVVRLMELQEQGWSYIRP
jgi:intracellular sulfur oxidation DsrE/DsrF family protein